MEDPKKANSYVLYHKAIRVWGLGLMKVLYSLRTRINILCVTIPWALYKQEKAVPNIQGSGF